MPLFSAAASVPPVSATHGASSEKAGQLKHSSFVPAETVVPLDDYIKLG